MPDDKKTENTFEGQPDDRQGGEIEVSRFRPKYRALSEDEKALHDSIKAKAEELESLYKQIAVKPGKDARYYKAGMLALEESVMWAVKELTS